MEDPASSIYTIQPTTPSTVTFSRTRSAREPRSPSVDLPFATPSQYPSGRNASPSRASTVSLSSNNTGLSAPHLKRKNRHQHIRETLQSALSFTSTSSRRESIPLASEERSTLRSQAASVAPSTPSTTIPSTHLSVTLARSNTVPSPRRGPASHSAHGAETTSGPPASYITQRAGPTEKPQRTSSTPLSQSIENTTDLASGVGHRFNSGGIDSDIPVLSHSSPETADVQSIPTPTDGTDSFNMNTHDPDRTISVGVSRHGSKTSSESHRSEDLFLNIAKTDVPRSDDKRKSRVSQILLPNLRPVTSHHRHPSSVHDETISNVARSERARGHIKQRSMGQYEGSYLANPRLVERPLAARDVEYERRRYSALPTTETVKLGRSNTVRQFRNSPEVVQAELPRPIDQNTAESTVSTTAPSTVWDELDDLKSRIRQLELTGKLPSASGAQAQGSDRPRTATTAATTVSDSPKKAAAPPLAPSAIEGISSNSHPLLHEAMFNAKALLNHDLYRSLHSTAQDALFIAQMTNSEQQAGIGSKPSSSLVDRQLARRAENMCRSLTELAIALMADVRTSSPSAQPASRETNSYSSPYVHLRSRRYSNANESSDRPPVSYRVVQSRLDSRRSSTQHSPELPSSSAVQYTTRPTYRSRMSMPGLDGTNEEDQQDLDQRRPMSRALTEVARPRRISRDQPSRASREYTSQHPLPVTTNFHDEVTKISPLPSHINPNFITRRKHVTPSLVSAPQYVESSPLAPRPSWRSISVVQPGNHDVGGDETNGTGRSVSIRRSFGQRLGSVSNKLKSVRSGPSQMTESELERDSEGQFAEQLQQGRGSGHMYE